MTKKIRNAFYTVASTALLLPAVVGAQYNLNGPPGNLPGETDANEMIIRIINWVLGILASLSILMIIIAGIIYITSGGDENRVGQAKSWLTYAIVGLIVALLGYVIVASVSKMLGV